MNGICGGSIASSDGKKRNGYMLVSSLGNDAQQACEALAQQYHRTLLEVSESIAAHRDLRELFHELAQSLHRVVRFDQMRLTLHDAQRSIMRVHTGGTRSEQRSLRLPGTAGARISRGGGGPGKRNSR